MSYMTVMERQLKKQYVKLDLKESVWNHVFMVAPLIVIGTKEGVNYDLAPKHMATIIGNSNYFAFICTSNHTTYQNIKRYKEFSVSFPIPEQVVLASLCASPRCGNKMDEKPILKNLPTTKCKKIDAVILKDSYLYFECDSAKIIDGFEEYSIITGKIIEGYVKKDYLKVSDKDEQLQIYENPLLAYIAHGRFAKITETYNFPFPKGFKR